MTNYEILEKAIQKAIDSGWQFKDDKYHYKSLKSFNGVWVVINFKETTFVEDEDSPVPVTTSMKLMELIFNHDFAKSLWPTQASGEVDPRAVSLSTAGPLIPTWKARLMEMVIADDPIKYLESTL